MRPDLGAAAATPATDPQALQQALRLMPPVLELLETSPLHYLHTVQFLFDRIFPSLVNGQFRLLMRQGRPMAFVNWAWLSDELSDKFSVYGQNLGPGDWNCGPNLWFAEIVVRDGMMHALIRDLQRNVFPRGTRARWVRVGPSGEVRGVGEVRMPGKAGPATAGATGKEAGPT
jgi:cytolysin-activating lysine-acyltransferase